MSRRKQSRPLIFRDDEIQSLKKAFPTDDPTLEADMKG